MTFSQLKLLTERKICEIVPCDEPVERWEASGVLAKDGEYFVVFDDRTEIARISHDLQPHSSNGLLGMSHAEMASRASRTTTASSGSTCWSKHGNMPRAATRL